MIPPPPGPRSHNLMWQVPGGEGARGGKVSYETVLALSGSIDVVVISTLPETLQECLIPGTTPCVREEKHVNGILEQKRQGLYTVIVYGANHLDATVERKCAQMRKMGFRSVHAYTGGMFEWLLLHEVYGEENFGVEQSSRSGVPDILAFRPRDREAGPNVAA